MRGIGHTLGGFAALALGLCASLAWAQQAAPPVVSAPAQDAATVKGPAGNGLGEPTPAAPALRLPSGLGSVDASGNLPGHDLAYSSDGLAGSQPGRSPIETETYFDSQDYKDSLGLVERPAHGGKASPAQQFGHAGEALAGNLVIGGVLAAINGGFSDGH
jgi:hypothetical protein